MPAQSKQKKQDTNKEVKHTPWYWLPFKGIEGILMIWLVLIIAEWCGPFWGWTVGQHAKDTLLIQVALLDGDHPGLAQQVTYYILRIFEQCQALIDVEFTGWFSGLTPYWQGVVYVSLALVARVVILMGFYPVFLLALFVGLFDGLVVRQRRIAHVERETVTVNYYSRRMLPHTLVWAGSLWLIIPGLFPLHPVWLLLPSAIVSGMMMRIAVSSYKKFL